MASGRPFWDPLALPYKPHVFWAFLVPKTGLLASGRPVLAGLGLGPQNKVKSGSFWASQAVLGHIWPPREYPGIWPYLGPKRPSGQKGLGGLKQAILACFRPFWALGPKTGHIPGSSRPVLDP